jgi:hypothetical protein
MKKVISLIGFLVSSTFLAAQTSDIRDVTNLTQLTLNECGTPDTMTIVYRGVSGSLTGVSLVDSLPEKIRIIGYIPSSNITSADLSDPYKPSFQLANVGSTSYDTIKMLIAAECDANTAASSYKHHFTLTHSGGSKSDSSAANFVSGIKAPVISLQPQGAVDFANATIGGTYTRVWKVQNTGVGSTLDSFTFRSILQAGISYSSLVVNGVTVTPTILGDTIIIYGIGTDLRNVAIFPGDTIRIEESFAVDFCPNTSQSSTVSAYWGCYSNQICKSDNQNPAVQVPNTVPNISWSIEEKIFNKCWETWDTVLVKFWNTSSNPAANVHFWVASGYGLQHSENRDSYASRLDTSRASFKIGLNGTWQKPSKKDYVDANAYAAWMGGFDGPSQVKYGIGTLQGGDTCYMYVPYFKPCPGNNGQRSIGNGCRSTNGYAWGSYKGNVVYTNECNTEDYETNSQSRYFYGRYSNLYNNNMAIVAPTDIDDGDTVTIQLQNNYGTRNFEKRADFHRWLRVVRLPAGLKYAGNSDTVLYRSGADTLVWDSASNSILWNVRGDGRGNLADVPVYLDCSAATSGGLVDIEDDMMLLPPSDCPSGCDTLYFSYDCKRQVRLHCPAPCERGGYVAKSFDIKRINFGLPDNDNNHIPDASGAIDTARVRTDRILSGDTISMISQAYISVGPQSPSLPFKFGYADVTLPHGSHFTPVTANLYIKDSSAGSSTVYTVQGITISKSGNTFSLDWSVSSLSGLPASLEFGQNDSVSIEMILAMTSAPGGSEIYPQIVESDIYVSHYANPTNDTAKYRCDVYSGSYEFIGANRFASGDGSGGIVINGCDGGTFNFRTYNRVGSAYPNGHRFDYEYRPIVYPDTFSFELPDGYTISRTQIRWAFSGGTVTDTLVLARQSGNMHYYDARGLIQGFGGTTHMSDEGDYVDFQVTLVPTCEAVSNLNDIRPRATQRWSTARPSSTHWGNNVAYNITGNGSAKAPLVDISNIGGVNKVAAERVVFWDFSVQNNSLAEDAPFTYIRLTNSSGAITADSILDLSTNSQVNLANGIYELGNINGGGSNKTFRIYATYTSCDDDTLYAHVGWNCLAYPSNISDFGCEYDSVSFTFTPVQPQLQTTFISRPARNSGGTAAEVNLCDTLEYRVSVSQRKEAVAYDLEFDILRSVGLFVVPDSVFVSFPGASSETQVATSSLNSTTDRIDVSSAIAAIGTDGLRKFSESPNNEYQVRIKFYTTCDYSSGDNIGFRARGTAPCGAQLPDVSEFDPIEINGAPSPKFHVVDIDLFADTIKGCGNVDTVYLMFENQELATSTSSDQFRLTLPDGAEYLPASINFTHGSFTTTTPTVDTILGRQRLTWEAAGVGANDSAKWNLTVQNNNIPGSCGLANFSAQSITGFTASCGAISCSSAVQNAGKSVDGIIAKSAISMVSSDIQITNDTGVLTNRDTMWIDLTLQNSGNYESGSFFLKIYQDNDNSGTVNAGDDLRLNVSLSSIPAGGSLDFDSIITASNQSFDCPIVLEYDFECDCNNDTLTQVSVCNVTLLPVEYTYFDVLKISNDKALVQWQTALEQDNHYFIVERSINTDQGFYPVDTVKGQGNSTQLTDYATWDNIQDIPHGAIYYRLKQVDFDGAVNYSGLRVIYKDGETAITVYPNPTRADLNIGLDNTLVSKGQEIVVEIFDFTGKPVRQASASNQSIITFKNMQYPSGVYHVRVSRNGLPIHQQKIVVVH